MTNDPNGKQPADDSSAEGETLTLEGRLEVGNSEPASEGALQSRRVRLGGTLMLDGNLAVKAAAASEPRPRLRNVIFGSVIVALVIGAALFVYSGLFTRWTADMQRFVVYFPGRASVAPGTSVTFERTSVGTVKVVDPARIGLQVTVFPHRVPEVPEVVTLLQGWSMKAPVGGDAVEIVLDSLTRASIAWNRVTIIGERTGAGRWVLRSGAAVQGVSKNGVPVLANPGDSVPLRAGDRIQFASGTSVVEVAWGDVDYLTRAEFAIDRESVLELAREAGVQDTTLSAVLGPGSGVALLTGFGRPRPELALRPSFYTGAVAAVVTSAPADSAMLAPIVSVDPLATVATLASYLASPAALRQEPTNRFEQAVFDANASLASLAGLTDQFNRAGKGDEPRGVGLRVLLEDQERRQLATVLGNAESATARLNTLARTIDVGTRDTLARGRLLHQLLDSGYVALQSSARNVESITARVNDPNGTLVRNVAGPAADALLTQLGDTTRTLAVRIAGPRADSIVSSVDSTATNVKAITQRVRKPGLLAAAAFLGASIVKNVVGIFR